MAENGTTDIPEPYATMSPTDPRRIEYLRDQMTGGHAATPELRALLKGARSAWETNRPLHFAQLSIATTMSSPHPDAPEPVQEIADVAHAIAAVETAGWRLESIQYVPIAGTTVSLGVGVKIVRGSIAAMMLFRRPAS